ncbi:MAG: DUF4870 domain-containing protein [Armatimonadetes bacterium]|nr:DUF4870 domain-containing protein [Armatimonadota bacterium]
MPPNSDAPEPTPEPTSTPAPEATSAPTESAPTPPMSAPTAAYPRAGGMVTQDEKTYAMLAWFLSIIFGLLAPLIIFLISNDKPFAKRHAAMALGFEIAMTICSIISGILMAVLIGLIILPVVIIFALVINIMGGMAASRGENYEPPIFGPMIAKMFNV